MDLRVHGPAPSAPFRAARDLFETERDLELPVHVHLTEDPDDRTRVAHYDDRHEITMARGAATSAMARELALHEFAHAARHEDEHPSHTQSTREAIYLALAGHSVERRTLAHCYQIANHMKDVYADDLWLDVAPGGKLVSLLESGLAASLADAPSETPARRRLTPTADPTMTAVNAAFALAIVERHDLADRDHRLYDLAHAAGADAPTVDLEAFTRRFRSLPADPDTSAHRKALVDATRAFAVADGDRAAD